MARKSAVCVSVGLVIRRSAEPGLHDALVFGRCKMNARGIALIVIGYRASVGKERVMVACRLRSVALVLLIAVLPTNFALAAGRGGGGLGGGVGAAGAGSAAVGGGAPAGRVGGGPPAGAVGGGSPGAGNPAGNGSAGTDNPSLNALGVGSGPGSTNAPGIPNATTKGGAFGGGAAVGATTGIAPARSFSGGAAPTAPANEPSSADSKKEGQPTEPTARPPVAGGADGADYAPFSPTGLSRPGTDGVSTVIVEARPCSVAAHETDGFTTCVGIPRKRHR
jgi:hypothetical protein